MNKIMFLVILVGCGVDGNDLSMVESPARRRTPVQDSAVDGRELATTDVSTGPSDVAVDPIPGPDVAAPAPDVSPPVDTAPVAPTIPSSVVPRRVGVACDRNDQCGAHAGKCLDGVCTACVGPQCGQCNTGASMPFACPFIGFTASACSYCEDDDRLWCDGDNPCPTGRCVSPDCR